VQKIVGLPNVKSVRRTFALGSRTYPAWFQDRLTERASSPTSPGGR
jgi:hypothetical protein